MMTAAVFAGAGFPTGVRDSPVLALPYHVFTLAQDSHDPVALETAWGAALVLVIGVLVLNLAVVPLHGKLGVEAEA
jgi:phosphate transport system permease protein